ncbi:hypothetical protein HYE36_04480 [Mycoplasmopsis bovis]|nr:hypothetical protein [Mycoplasmopsis bovis]WHL49149.1 hypothetical protein HYE36_04480 [Mycoplasmopsis bovis]
MNEIREYVAENSLKRSSAEELAKLFADNIEKLQEFILKSLQGFTKCLWTWTNFRIIRIWKRQH